jgi:hypothetical protein
VNGPDDPDLDEGPQAEDRATDAAAGAPAGDRDVDDLLDEPDAASG